MDIAWEDLKLFLAVAEGRSMSAAARALRVAQPTLSRRIGELEEQLEAPVFIRRSDGVALTPLGERLLHPAKQMAEWAVEAGRSVASRENAPEGCVRIAAPPGVAFDFLVPLAAKLRTRVPGVRLEIMAGVEFVSLGRGEADLAMRSRAPTERDLVGLVSLEVSAAVMASKAYARRLPKKYGFEDIDWIAWAPPYDQTPPNPQLAALLGDRFRPVLTSNDYLVQVAALEAGVGAMIVSKKYHRLSRLDQLTTLKCDLGPAARATFHLVAAKRMVDVPRIRAVTEAIKAELL